MKMFKSFTCLFFFVLLLGIGGGCKQDKQEQPAPQPLPPPAPQHSDSVSIGGKNYRTVAIQNQVWTVVNYAGPGGLSAQASGDKQEYGKYYTYEEVQAIPLPAGWRLPTRQDYITLAQSQGITFTNNRATDQEAIKKLVSTAHWRKVPGSNASGFNALPGGYSFQNQDPQDGDLAEFWTVEGSTMSIQENAGGKTHNITFYNNSESPEYRFNVRFIRNK